MFKFHKRKSISEAINIYTICALKLHFIILKEYLILNILIRIMLGGGC